MKIRRSLYFGICTLFIILWGLYGFHWYDSAKGTTIDEMSNVFLGINLAICSICIISLHGKTMPTLFRGVNALLFTFILYGGLYIAGGETHFLNGSAVNKGSYLIGILRSYLPLYAFYYFTFKGYINAKSISFYFVILFVFALLYNVLFSRYWVDIGYDSGFTNNLGFVFVSFFPFIYLYKGKPLFQYCILILIVGLTILSMKRGAIIISLLLTLRFIYTSISNSKSFQRFLILVLAIVFMVIGYHYIENLYESSSYFQTRIEQTLAGNSSGRDVLYAKLWEHFWNDSSIFQQLFGSGPNATLDILGKEAHNDWLEILICQGLFGVIVYAFFWLNCIRYLIRIPKKTVYYPIVEAFLLTQFLRTLFSMSYSTIPTAATLILGYSIALNEMQEKEHVYKS